MMLTALQKRRLSLVGQTITYERCKIKKIIFQDKITDFVVFTTDCPDGEVKARGHMPNLHKSEKFTLIGQYVEEKPEQTIFDVEAFEPLPPETTQDILNFLSSGAVKGVGRKTAEKIVEVFGLDTYDIIINNPEQLTVIRGIGKAKAVQIADEYKNTQHMRILVAFLYKHDIRSPSLAKALYLKYKNRAIDILKENPYQLTDDMYGIGFKKADKMALKLGFEKDCPLRLSSGIIYAIKELEDKNGDTCAYIDKIYKKADELLEVDRGIIEKHMDIMKMNREVIWDVDKDENVVIFRAVMFFSERKIARRVRDIALEDFDDHIDLNRLIEQAEDELDLDYDDVQRSAIRTAIESKFTVITGGPGTGKTTITLGILTALEESKERVLLAAPTGRAAKRMAEVTKRSAYTIHKLLKYSPDRGFGHNEKDPLVGNTIIVDEASMIDTILMTALMRAIPDSMRVIIVGDVDQLPSVGPGKIIHDLIESKTVPVVRLKKIYRQNGDSLIIPNAHAINNGVMPELYDRKHDFFFIKEKDEKRVADIIANLVEERLPKCYHVKPTDIQVLSPKKQGSVGIHKLNAIIQNRLNPLQFYMNDYGDKKPLALRVLNGEESFEIRPNDKVMATRNNYDLDVYNGDIGTVESIDCCECTADINFDGRTVRFKPHEIRSLLLAYACTIHKSQGSEYDIVIIPMVFSHNHMLERNLLYTAVTRAKKVCIIVGTEFSVQTAVNKTNAKERITKLKERLEEEFSTVY